MGQNRRAMSLDELRRALSSTATRQAERLEKENRQLRAEIREKDRIIAERRDICSAMFNRCLVLTRGATCVFCTHDEMCKAERTIDKEAEEEK